VTHLTTTLANTIEEPGLKTGSTGHMTSTDNHEMNQNAFMGRKAIIIDENEETGKLMCQQLAQWGIDTVQLWYKDGQLFISNEALYRAGKFDLVILNTARDTKKSLKISRAIKTNTTLGQLPMIVLNNANVPDLKVIFARIGVDHQVTKPVKRDELYEVLLAVFDKSDLNNMVDLCEPVKDEPSQQTELEDKSEDTLDILIAEDNLVNQMVITEFLKLRPISIKLVDNGRLAVEAYKKNRPALILMDVSMPEMTGLEASEEIRKIEATKDYHTPIIAVTAHVLKHDLTKCLDAGMDDTLTKPLSKESLFAKIDQWMPSGIQLLESVKKVA